MRTKANQERIAASCLNSKGITCFLPTRKVPNARSSAGRHPTHIMFPGYLFVCPRPDDLFGLRYIPGTCGVLAFNGKPAKLDTREIDSIQMLANSDVSLEKHDQLHLGQKIYLKQGPLAGIQGELIRIKNVNRLVVNVEILNQSVSVEVNKDWLIAA